MQNTKIEGLWERCALVVLCGACGVMALLGISSTGRRATDGLRTHQLVHAINVANVAQVGNVTEVAVKHEESRPMVHVGISSPDGRKYAVKVEGSTGKVLSVAPHPDCEANETSTVHTSNQKKPFVG